MRVVVDNLDPDRLYDLYAKYNLVESVYSSDVTHLECQTRRAGMWFLRFFVGGIEIKISFSAPAVTPKIPRGGYMILEDQLILYLDVSIFVRTAGQGTPLPRSQKALP